MTTQQKDSICNVNFPCLWVIICSVTYPLTISCIRGFAPGQLQIAPMLNPSLQIENYHANCGLKIAMTPLNNLKMVDQNGLLSRDGKLYENCHGKNMFFLSKKIWQKYSGGAYQNLTSLHAYSKCPD